MDMGIAGRRAAVLGGGKGIGRAIALGLAAEGAKVIIGGRDQAALETTCAAFTSGAHGGSVTAQRCDLSSEADIAAFIAVVGEADILVNNGGGPPAGPISQVDDATWLKHFEAMFLGTVRMTRGFLPGMRARGFGRILTVTSSGTIQPIPHLGISNAMRMAVTGWSKTLSLEVAPDGVTMNCLAPGRIQTDRVDALDMLAAEKQGLDLETVRKNARAGIPVGRYGSTEEFANLAVFLASPHASYITGSIHRIDGGATRCL